MPNIDIWALQPNGSAERVPVSPKQILGIFVNNEGLALIMLEGDRDDLIVDKLQAQLIYEQWQMWKRGQEPMQPRQVFPSLRELIQERLDRIEQERKQR